MSTLDIMIEKAREAMANTYSPYSQFPVGCCVRTAKNRLYHGCNVENASYSLTLCAEASAIAQMVTQGETTIAEIVVMGTGKELCAPCGACRQRIREFAAPETLVHICGPEGLRKTMTLSELLPESFGPHNLEK